MGNKENVNARDESVIDLEQIFRALLRKLWLLILAVIVFAALGFAVTFLFITPKYSTTFTAYVNNHNSTDVLTSLNNSDMSARVTLANTAAKIATSSTVSNKVAMETGVSPSEIGITTSVDSSSSILTVRVIMADKDKVKPVADSLAAVLTEESGRIIEGSSLQVIDMPVEPTGRYSPSYSRNVMLAAVIGFVLMALIIIIIELKDDTLKDAADLENEYGIPVVGAIPDMSVSGKKSGYGGYGYGYGYGYGGAKSGSADGKKE